MISYKNEVSLKLTDFEDHAECRIPHKVVANGVKIETDQGHILRLTDDHLIFTSRGLIAASKVVSGDTLFTTLSTSMNNNEMCHVLRVAAETGQTYFGLNCLESTVLANGIKTSTFGKYHAVPAWWMRLVGSFLGAHKASSIGDSVVELLAKIKLL